MKLLPRVYTNEVHGGIATCGKCVPAEVRLDQTAASSISQKRWINTRSNEMLPLSASGVAVRLAVHFKF